MSDLQLIELALAKKYARKIQREAADICAQLNLDGIPGRSRLSYTRLLDALSTEVGKKSLQEHQREANGKTLSEILPPLVQQGVPFRFRIGSTYWSVEMRAQGPVLRFGSGNPDAEICLGLCPVIQRSQAHEHFMLTMYGSWPIMSLDFLQAHEVKELSRLAGIPVWNEPRFSSHPSGQQLESEAAFLKSPAFAYVRWWFRQGGHRLINAERWGYYLSDAWIVLVALSDDDFAERRSAADWLLRESWNRAGSVGPTRRAIEAAWPNLPQDGSRLALASEAELQWPR